MRKNGHFRLPDGRKGPLIRSRGGEGMKIIFRTARRKKRAGRKEHSIRGYPRKLCGRCRVPAPKNRAEEKLGGAPLHGKRKQKKTQEELSFSARGVSQATPQEGPINTTAAGKGMQNASMRFSSWGFRNEGGGKEGTHPAGPED